MMQKTITGMFSSIYLRMRVKCCGVSQKTLSHNEQAWATYSFSFVAHTKPYTVTFSFSVFISNINHLKTPNNFSS